MSLNNKMLGRSPNPKIHIMTLWQHLYGNVMGLIHTYKFWQYLPT